MGKGKRSSNRRGLSVGLGAVLILAVVLAVFAGTSGFLGTSSKKDQGSIKTTPVDEKQITGSKQEEADHETDQSDDSEENKNLLDQFLSYTLPDGLSDGDCRYGYTSETTNPCRLFETEETKKTGIYGYKYTMIWSGAGGVMFDHLSMAEGTEELGIAWSGYEGNGGNAPKGNVIKRSERKAWKTDFGRAGLEKVRIGKNALRGELCWYCRPNGMQGKNDTTDLPEEKETDQLLPKTLWVGYVLPEGNEDTGAGYVFFLDANQYKKGDMRALLDSVELLR